MAIQTRVWNDVELLVLTKRQEVNERAEISLTRVQNARNFFACIFSRQVFWLCCEEDGWFMEMPVCIHCRRVFMAVLWVVKRVFLLWWWSCNSVGGKSRAWACFCFVLQATTEHYRWWHWPRTWIYYTYQYHQLPPIIWSHTVKNNSVIFKSYSSGLENGSVETTIYTNN